MLSLCHKFDSKLLGKSGIPGSERVLKKFKRRSRSRKSELKKFKGQSRNFSMLTGLHVGWGGLNFFFRKLIKLGYNSLIRHKKTILTKFQLIYQYLDTAYLDLK